MKTCPSAAENTEDNLLLKKRVCEFFKGQWMHFTGEVYKSKTAYVSISILYTRNYFDWLIFDWVIQEKNKVAFLRHCA